MIYYLQEIEKALLSPLRQAKEGAIKLTLKFASYTILICIYSILRIKIIYKCFRKKIYVF